MRRYTAVKERIVYCDKLHEYYGGIFDVIVLIDYMVDKHFL